MPHEFKTAVVWFRRDLRVDDNPALVAALAAAPNVVSWGLTPTETGRWVPWTCWQYHGAVSAHKRRRLRDRPASGFSTAPVS